MSVTCTDCLGDAVSWGYSGGLVIYSESSSLSPCRTYERKRAQATDGGVALSCSDEIGACADSTIAVGDVERAFAHPDVLAAFAKSPAPIYGVDSRAVDGAILQIDRGGKSFYVGGDCGGTSAPACVPIPPGVKALATLLLALDTQEIDKPACAAFK